MKMFVLTKKLIKIQNDIDIINMNRRSLRDIEKQLATLSSKALDLSKNIRNSIKTDSYNFNVEEDDLIANKTNEIKNDLIYIINMATIHGLNKKKFDIEKLNDKQSKSHKYTFLTKIEKYLTYLIEFCTAQSKDLSKRQKKLTKHLNKLVPKELQKS